MHECQRSLYAAVYLVISAVVTAKVPEYRQPRSNYIYSYRQNIAPQVLREYLDFSYRCMYEAISANPI